MLPKFLPLARRLATRPLRLQRGHRASLCIIGIIAWRPCANETPHHNQRSAQEACGSPSGSCRGRPCHLVVLFRVNPLSSRIRHSCHQSVMPVATGKRHFTLTGKDQACVKRLKGPKRYLSPTFSQADGRGLRHASYRSLDHLKLRYDTSQYHLTLTFASRLLKSKHAIQLPGTHIRRWYTSRGGNTRWRL